MNIKDKIIAEQKANANILEEIKDKKIELADLIKLALVKLNFNQKQLSETT
jgi:hypothetical protein